ncbi:UNVERIFIED_CONTAM: zinc finger, matrin-type 2 [Siphonaria sp. JEL0065]|nr:zinc finger, matrin-type 2 [Siphonaria sp. JEL0065]
MSGKSFYAGAAPGGDTGFRKTWDKDEYAKKAREREESMLLLFSLIECTQVLMGYIDARSGKKDKKDDDKKEPESLLKQREGTIDFKSVVNKTQMVNATGGPAGQPGFYCEACNIVCKDNVNWLDHLNGFKHLKNIGQSTKVEKSTAEQVAARIAMLTKKRKEPAKEYDLAAQVKKGQDEEEAAKLAKKESKKRKKEEKSKAQTEAASEGVDADMAAMMGFGGFGTSKKK